MANELVDALKKKRAMQPAPEAKAEGEPVEQEMEENDDAAEGMGELEIPEEELEMYADGEQVTGTFAGVVQGGKITVASFERDEQQPAGVGA